MFELKTTDETYRFDQPRLTIGENGEWRCPGAILASIHAIIEWKNGHYILENKAHDPHFLINGKPFWKRKLENEDRISIGDSHIVYHYISHCSHAAPPPSDNANSSIHTAEEILKQISLKKDPIPVPPQKVQFKHTQPDSGYWHLFVLAFSCLFLFAVLFSTTFYITITERAEVERLYAARGLADISMILDYVKNESIDPPFKKLARSWFPQRNWTKNPP